MSAPPTELEAILDSGARDIITGAPELGHYALAMYQGAQRELAAKGISGDWKLTTFTEPESSRGPMLVLECKIHGMGYSEVLVLWKELSLKTSHSMPLDARKRIALVLDTAKHA